MLRKKVAIIGAGPSGLVAEKECLEAGLIPVVYERQNHLGGVWHPETGKVWTSMRTNLSHFHMGFSDFPWPDFTPDFPWNQDVFSYLQDYAATFDLEPHIQYNQNVRSIRYRDSKWHIDTDKTGDFFDHLIVANGVFNANYIPSIKGSMDCKIPIMHSGDYKTADEFNGKTLVVGGSFSAYEIASDIAHQGRQVTHLFKRPSMIIERFVSRNGCLLPLDIAFNHYPTPDDPVNDREMAQRKKIEGLQKLFGDAGDIHSALSLDLNDACRVPIVVSDDYVKHIKNGIITPFRDQITELTAHSCHLQSGQTLQADRIIFCTGYQSDIPFANDVSNIVNYQKKDQFQPLILNNNVLHPKLPSLAFTGLYRGPYFGVMEMQARWAAAIFSGQRGYPNTSQFMAGLQEELELRRMEPRPQFPRSNYVALMLKLSKQLGTYPSDLLREMNDNTINMLPADFRRQGIGANPHMALAQRQRLDQRLQAKNYDA